MAKRKKKTPEKGLEEVIKILRPADNYDAKLILKSVAIMLDLTDFLHRRFP